MGDGTETTAGDSSTPASSESASDNTTVAVGCGDGIAEPGEFCFEEILMPEVKFPVAADAVVMDLGFSFFVLAQGDEVLYRVTSIDGSLVASSVSPLPVRAESRVHAAPMHGTSRGDLVVTSLASKTVRVFENQWTAVGVPNEYIIGAGPGVLVDADGDGISELITGGFSKAFLWKYDPDTDAWTQQLAEYAVHGCGALWASVTADFNADSLDDVAYIGSPTPLSESVECDDLGFHRISVLLSNSQFGYPVVSDSIVPGFVPEEIGAGDFDGDGKLDLAVTSSPVHHTLAVLPGLGDGTFADPVLIDGSYSFLAVGNLDGDAEDEIVTNNGNLVIVDTPLSTPLVHELGLEGRPLSVADVNADGIDDIAYNGSFPSALRVLRSMP